VESAEVLKMQGGKWPIEAVAEGYFVVAKGSLFVVLTMVLILNMCNI
jgi:hypothetical protein